MADPPRTPKHKRDESSSSSSQASEPTKSPFRRPSANETDLSQTSPAELGSLEDSLQAPQAPASTPIVAQETQGNTRWTPVPQGTSTPASGAPLPSPSFSPLAVRVRDTEQESPQSHTPVHTHKKSMKLRTGSPTKPLKKRKKVEESMFDPPEASTGISTQYSLFGQNAPAPESFMPIDDASLTPATQLQTNNESLIQRIRSSLSIYYDASPPTQGENASEETRTTSDPSGRVTAPIIASGQENAVLDTSLVMSTPTQASSLRSELRTPANKSTFIEFDYTRKTDALRSLYAVRRKLPQAPLPGLTKTVDNKMRFMPTSEIYSHLAQQDKLLHSLDPAYTAITDPKDSRLTKPIAAAIGPYDSLSRDQMNVLYNSRRLLPQAELPDPYVSRKSKSKKIDSDKTRKIIIPVVEQRRNLQEQDRVLLERDPSYTPMTNPQDPRLLEMQISTPYDTLEDPHLKSLYAARRFLSTPVLGPSMVNQVTIGVRNIIRNLTQQDETFLRQDSTYTPIIDLQHPLISSIVEENSEQKKPPHDVEEYIEYLTHGQLRRIARTNRERLIREHQIHVLENGEGSLREPKFPKPPNYFFESTHRLSRHLKDVFGGIGYYLISIEGKRNALKRLYAERGVDPILDPSLTSRFHGQASMHLKQGKTTGSLIKDNIIAQKIYQDRNNIQIVDQSNYLKIAKLLTQDIEDALQRRSHKQRRPYKVPSTFMTTWNENLYGAPDAMILLQNAVSSGLAPAFTENTGHLCGPRALSIAVQAVRREINRNTEYRAELITADQIMDLAFTNYDAAVANDPRRPIDSNAMGRPTPEYQRIVRARLSNLDQDDPSQAVIYREEYQEYMRLNNLNVNAISALLELLGNVGVIEEEMILGIVTDRHEVTRFDGTITQMPAFVRVIDHTIEYDTPDRPNPPVVFILNDSIESEGGMNHYEGFDHNSREEDAQAWGLITPSSTLMPSRRFHPEALPDLLIETPEQRATREASNARAVQLKRERLLRAACHRCREDETIPCDGRRGEPCSVCIGLQEECIFDETNVPAGVLHHGVAKMTESDLMPWQTPNPDQEVLDKYFEDAMPAPEPAEKHFLVITCFRMSSHQGMAIFNQLVARLGVSTTTYDQFLAGARYTQFPEGVRPGGPGTPMRTFGIVVARQGTRPVPWQLGNIFDPYLVAFVTLLHDYTRPGNTNRPIQTHFLLHGFAGLSVNINGWGSRKRGFFKFLLDVDARNGDTHFQDSTYLVVLSQPKAVDGVGPESYFQGHNAPPAGYVGHRGKYVYKCLLKDLVDREAGVPFQNPAYQQRLDNLLGPMDEEYFWRAGGLGPNTQPTPATLEVRNDERNREWR